MGRRIVVSPSWEQCQAGADDVVILIDPDMAFGTGQHATTRFCLEQMERHIIPGSRVLDAGCGSGILAIAAARLGAGTVTGIDNDELAVRIATENVIMNGVQAQVNILPDDLNALAEEKTPAFDIIVANLTDQLLAVLAEGLYAVLAKGGKLIAAGINHERWAALKDRLLASGFALAEEAADGEWIGAVLMK
ncbi:MAG: 50S ribosomal protein L11 methyltransferase [Syntrophomonadaceae bacterium]|nr:50S ribosomal protein L11 methyltransferase [Syntrophomonadaceae bacterium]